jgi:hypothetical protein
MGCFYAKTMVEGGGNTRHEPAGSPKGGQFAHAVGGADIVLQRMEQKHGKENILAGKGGIFVRRQGKGAWTSLAKARTETNVSAPKSTRVKREKQLPWGDYATIAAMSGRLKG